MGPRYVSLLEGKKSKKYILDFRFWDTVVKIRTVIESLYIPPTKSCDKEKNYLIHHVQSGRTLEGNFKSSTCIDITDHGWDSQMSWDIYNGIWIHFKIVEYTFKICIILKCCVHQGQQFWLKKYGMTGINNDQSTTWFMNQVQFD